MSAPHDEIQIQQRRLDLIDAELWIVGPPEMTGRLTGPKTRYASTVEVPYYLQKIPTPNAPAGAQRVLVPEPMLWSPASPYLYEAKLDLGANRGKTSFAWGFRRLAWSKDGLRVNGSLLPLQMERRASLTESEAIELRERGVNVVQLPGFPLDHTAWDVADRVGLFILAGIGHQFDVARQLQRHPSSLGFFIDPRLSSVDELRQPGSPACLLGMMQAAGDGPPPTWADFVLTADGELSKA